ncbi:putative monovalent cation/H+ antiporter subunit F [Alloiococcus otitis]|uniref:Multiple resistance and pH regulation protein F n=1 Tax=Alloiococcus otitis ATCC 51267 TaxID=883081 RepID=K9E9W6_9LACT|nr:monovalent cation/H+ antiporter complex subunit F [Alloiococcus otitis]EKU94004.1 hypothetical protein HMPREF9698_00484 [Alloiococcus otitis ATCC 51267]SUU80911.1 putative monovalent cation/H+ antiporter subunit F [Alloiococcus otitis]
MSFDLFVLIAMMILSLGAIYRVIMGPTVWDRLLGSSFFSAKAIVMAVVLGVVINRTYMVDVGIIYGILGFVSVIMIARFIERKGDI